jgi:hypothetical protein
MSTFSRTLLSDNADVDRVVNPDNGLMELLEPWT